MSDPFMSEIRIFAGDYAPRGWAFCDGKLLPISQNTALFSLVGVTYGGDGRITYGLPDLVGRAPMHVGDSQGSGLSPRFLGGKIGDDKVALTVAQLPQHNHAFQSTRNSGQISSPVDARPARSPNEKVFVNSNANLVSMSDKATGITGGNRPHENMQPYLVMNFIIALQGRYPAKA